MKPQLKISALVLLTGTVLFISCRKEIPNKPPLANAGKDKLIIWPTANVILNGGAYDSDGRITGYQWTKISGPSAFRMANPTALKTLVEELDAGVYAFELKITDNEGMSSTDTLQVTVDNTQKEFVFENMSWQLSVSGEALLHLDISPIIANGYSFDSITGVFLLDKAGVIDPDSGWIEVSIEQEALANWRNTMLYCWYEADKVKNLIYIKMPDDSMIDIVLDPFEKISVKLRFRK